MSSDYRVADFVADYLAEELNLKHIFFVTGAGIMHLTDGLAKNPRISPVALHHEQSCSMASDAYSKVNNRLSVSMYSTGPAATNAITGLAGAWQDSVPSIFISGQVKLSESTFAKKLPKGVRQFGVQELNIAPIVENITKYFVQIHDPQTIRYELEKATYLAKSGRPGPVWIEIPMDIQAAKIDKQSLVGFIADNPEPSTSKARELASEVAEVLRKSSRPVILAGRGVMSSGASTALQRFATENRIPIVSTYLGIDGLATENEVYVGKIGVKGDRAGNLAIQNADVVLALGTSLHVSATGYEYSDFAREAKLIVVDIDPATHQKETVKIHRFVHSDVGEMVSSLSAEAKGQSLPAWADWNENCRAWKSRYPVDLKEYSEGPEINIYKFVSRLSELAPENAVFVSDAGSAYYAVSQGLKISNSAQRYITSGAMATMGFTLPAAIGASFSAGPECPILAVTGDGSFQQNIQELQVIVQHKLPVKVFVLNNGGYLSIRASQKNYFESREIGAGPDSGLTFPDSLKVASAYGIESEKVKDLADLDSAIARAIAWDGPFILDVSTPPDQLIIPTVSSRLDENGVMKSRPLEDMFPFLDRDEFLDNLFVDPI
jgi:acetolactate synthase-1/2/3 large subunit